MRLINDWCLVVRVFSFPDFFFIINCDIVSIVHWTSVCRWIKIEVELALCLTFFITSKFGGLVQLRMHCCLKSWFRPVTFYFTIFVCILGLGQQLLRNKCFRLLLAIIELAIATMRSFVLTNSYMSLIIFHFPALNHIVVMIIIDVCVPIDINSDMACETRR